MSETALSAQYKASLLGASLSVSTSLSETTHPLLLNVFLGSGKPETWNPGVTVQTGPAQESCSQRDRENAWDVSVLPGHERSLNFFSLEASVPLKLAHELSRLLLYWRG